MHSRAMALSRVELEQRSFLTKVYGWVAFALGITALISMYVVSSPSLTSVLLG